MTIDLSLADAFLELKARRRIGQRSAQEQDAVLEDANELSYLDSHPRVSSLEADPRYGVILYLKSLPFIVESSLCSAGEYELHLQSRWAYVVHNGLWHPATAAGIDQLEEASRQSTVASLSDALRRVSKYDVRKSRQASELFEGIEWTPFPGPAALSRIAVDAASPALFLNAFLAATAVYRAQDPKQEVRDYFDEYSVEDDARSAVMSTLYNLHYKGPKILDGAARAASRSAPFVHLFEALDYNLD